MATARTVEPRAKDRGANSPSTATQFLKILAAIQSAIDVTARDGRALTLEEGLAQGIAMIEQCARNAQKLIFIGNGGSAGIASHQAVDYWKNGGVEAIAFNDASLLTCIGNDYGYDRVFAEPIRRFAKPGDLLIAISSSGRSPNILRAVETADAMGCSALTLSGFDADNGLRRLGGLNFYVPSYAYGIVEITHLSLLHAMLDERIAERQRVTQVDAASASAR